MANDNSPKQQVLSGTTETIDKAITIASAQGFKAIKLQVSAPFHSTLMVSAKQKLGAALADIKVTQPKIPLIANISANIIDVKDIKANLEQQVTGLVKWCDSIKKLKALEVTAVAEIGPGRVLSNLNKQIEPDILALTFDECCEYLSKS